MEIRIWSNTCAGVVGLKRFIISWFIVFSSRAGFATPAAKFKTLTLARSWLQRRAECRAPHHEEPPHPGITAAPLSICEAAPSPPAKDEADTGRRCHRPA